MSFKTDQEHFWAETFGSEYVKRNQGDQLLSSNIALFSDALKRASQLDSCLEFGPNIGLNLKALKVLFPKQLQYGVEINSDAVAKLKTFLPSENIFNQSILEFDPNIETDIVLIKGVLIHINPEFLSKVYEKMYLCAKKYILICEYYNPTPVSVRYRGHEDRLFKRDFCGELLDMYKDLHLLDYGFVYHRDHNFPQDDANWFLLEKN